VRNLITDVPGVLVGNAQDRRAATGVTVALFEQSTVASVATLGGAPGSRAVTLLEPEMTRGLIDAVVLSAAPFLASMRQAAPPRCWRRKSAARCLAASPCRWRCRRSCSIS
jgi:Peptidase family S58